MNCAVIDASVGVAWFVPEDEATLRAASSILDDIVEGRVHPLVPELFCYELLAVIVRRTASPGAAAAAHERLGTLGISRLVTDPPSGPS